MDGSGEKEKTKTQGTHERQSEKKRDVTIRGDAALKYPAVIGDSRGLHDNGTTTVFGAIGRDTTIMIAERTTRTLVTRYVSPLNVTQAKVLTRFKGERASVFQTPFHALITTSEEIASPARMSQRAQLRAAQRC